MSYSPPSPMASLFNEDFTFILRHRRHSSLTESDYDGSADVSATDSCSPVAYDDPITPPYSPTERSRFSFLDDPVDIARPFNDSFLGVPERSHVHHYRIQPDVRADSEPWLLSPAPSRPITPPLLPVLKSYNKTWTPPAPRDQPRPYSSCDWQPLDLSPISTSGRLSPDTLSSSFKTCIFCDTELHEGISLHNKLHHPFACQICRVDLPTQEALNDHNGIAHNRRLLCKTCGRAFAEIEHLNQHKRDSHRKKCSTCDKVFYSPGGLEMHIRAKHQWPETS